jgi:hypothetical protein
MLESRKADEIGEVDLAPRAVVRRSVAELRDRLAITFEPGEDDLDCYEAAFFALDGMVFALIHHRGEPPDGVSVYLRRDLYPWEAARTVRAVMTALELPPELLVWQDTEAPHHAPV